VRDVADRHARMLAAADPAQRLNLLCELNVIDQVRHVAQSTVLQDAWARGQTLTVHGWVYGLNDGLLKDLRISVSGAGEVEATYQEAQRATAERYGAVAA